MGGRLWAMMRKEATQILRDRLTLGVVLVFPTLLLLLFGYAVSFDVHNVSLAACDQDGSRRSREFTAMLTRTGHFTSRLFESDCKALGPDLDGWRASVAVVLPPGFGRRIDEGQAAPVQALVDGSDSTAASTVLGYLGGFVQNYATGIALKALARRAAALGLSPGQATMERLAPVDLRPRILYNPELKSARFLVPGLMGFIAMVVCVVITAISIAREWERGTMEQLICSPIRPAELILGKLLPYGVLGVAETLLILAAGSAAFDVEVKGSLALLCGLTVLFVTAGLGMGLFISSVARTQQMAFLVAMVVSLLPSFLLSGFVFPIRNMPVAVQAFTYLVPTRYYLTILRGIMLKGVGLEVLWPQAAALAAFATVMLTASALRWRKTMR